MKLLNHALFPVIAPMTCFAASLFMPSAATAQSINNPSAPPGDPTWGQPVTYVIEPGTSNFIPTYTESMGMRQDRINAQAGMVGQPIAFMLAPDTAAAIPTVNDATAPTGQPAVETVNTGRLVQAGMAPAWLGIAASLDAEAATGQPARCLATPAVDTELRTAPLGESQIKLYQMRIQASQYAANVAQSKAVQFSGDTQAQLRDAVREMDSRRGELQTSLDGARNSAPNDQNRANLVSAYNRYSEAAARVQQLTSS